MLGARALQSRLLRATGLMRPEVVIFDITHRCTSRCVGCAFREPEPDELPTSTWIDLAREARAIGFQEIMLTGGEPLAHPEISFLLPGIARALPVSLITNGLALAKHSGLVRDNTARVFVSWDAASDAVYERIRGVRGLAAVRSGVKSLVGHHVHARVTVWAENVRNLREVRDVAQEAGCSEMSLLACDTGSEGFGAREEVRGVPPRAEDLPFLASFLDSTRGDPFVVMSEYAKQRLQLLAAGRAEGPRCAAPWTSGVVDPTGRWRHCFFLGTGTAVDGGLAAAMRAARPARRALDVSTNETCARCVCWRG